MTYDETLGILKRGGKVSREGKIYQIHRGIVDVTDPENPVRVFVHDGADAQPGFGGEARDADDWIEESASASPPVVVSPIDEVLSETVPETLGTLDKESPQ
jgi:hypothetical protein